MIKVIQHLDNEYIFELKAESGHTLLKSVPFSDKQSAIKTANDLSRFAKKSSSFERKTNHSGQFLFNFKNSNGLVIGSSQLYNSEAGMENGIKNLANRITSFSKFKSS